MEDKSHLTAIGRKGPSVPARKALRHMARNATVLDWGCGRGADVKFFRDRGLISAGYDLNHRVDESAESLWCYDYITCTYVLNVIEPDHREECLTDMLEYARPWRNTQVFVAARAKRDLEKNVRLTWIRHADGWITPKGTFQHGFELLELRDLLASVGVVRMETLLDSSGTVMLSGLYEGPA